MSELRDILREEYIKQINQLDLKMLLEMVEDVMSQPLSVTEEIEAPTVDAASDQETLDMILKMIPNIEVSEIGWSDVSTTDKGEVVSGPQRALLENYLNNIAGSTFQERIDNVGMFYADGAGIISQGENQSRAGRITQAISYLVFYKTLTKVITNFNASSAGFSFESFLSALVKGQQIQTGSKTIADYTDNLSGEEIPVSLKLYREGGLEVGGSYTDLINDLVEPKFQFKGMRYVVCTKDLKGDDLEQEGEIRFWQFDFTLDNVMWILANSKDVSAECIRIPQAVVSKLTGKGAQAGEDQYENILGLPSKAVMPSADEIYNDIYIPKLKRILALARSNTNILPKSSRGLLDHILRSELEFNSLLDELNWETNDQLFDDYVVVIPHKKGEEPELDPATGKPVKQRENKGKVRGLSAMSYKGVNEWAKGWVESYWKTIEENPQKNPQLYKLLSANPKTGRPMTDSQRKPFLNNLAYDLSAVLRGANNAKRTWKKGETKAADYDARADDLNGVLGIFRASEIDAERKAMIKAVLETEGGFLSPGGSAAFYGNQPTEYKKIILKHTLGYLTTLHFSLNQKQATDKAPPGETKYDKDDNTGEDVKVQGGVGADYLGEIKVGSKYVAEALAGVRDILNEEILEIFQALKALSDSLNGFFAGGLKDDSLAIAAVSNANSISSTEVLQAPGGGKQMPLPFDK